MDKPIQPGDLVMVVRGCCPHDSWGIPWRVEAVRIPLKQAYCAVCRRKLNAGKTAFGDFVSPVAWLKRFDPDALNNSIPETEKLEA